MKSIEFEQLKVRLKALEEQRQQIQAVLAQAQGVINKAAGDLLRIDGQIQEVQYWLKGEENGSKDETENNS